MTDDQRQRYLDELARLGSPDEVRDYLKRLQSLGELGTPEEFRRFIRGLGTPEEIALRRTEFNRMIETQHFYARVFSSLKVVALWTAAVLAAWAMFQGAVAKFIEGFIP